jgi:hypothetical protein
MRTGLTDEPARTRAPMIKEVQAKHVPELPILRAIKANEPHWTLTWDLFELPELKEFPHKVVRAKLLNMYNSGLIGGCCCGCRGDFELKPAGLALLKELETTPQ